MRTPVRERRFFRNIEAAQVFAQAKGQEKGCHDVTLVPRKNAEDLTRMPSAKARIEGAFVIWSKDQ